MDRIRNTNSVCRSKTILNDDSLRSRVCWGGGNQDITRTVRCFELFLLNEKHATRGLEKKVV
jgi:hypothetical protein